MGACVWVVCGAWGCGSVAVSREGYLTEAEFVSLMMRGFLNRPQAEKGACHPEDLAGAFSAYVEAAADGMGLLLWRAGERERNR